MPDTTPSQPGSYGFQRDLEALINRYSLENGSHTPDFILAAYLVQCLQAYETLQTMRDGWYGVPRQQPAQAPEGAPNP